MHEFFTFSMVSSESNMTPRFRHWETGAMDVEPTVRGSKRRERDLFLGVTGKKIVFVTLCFTR